MEGGDLAFLCRGMLRGERKEEKEGRGDGYLYGFFSAHKVAVPRVVRVYPPPRDKPIVIVIKRTRTIATHSGSWGCQAMGGGRGTREQN